MNTSSPDDTYLGNNPAMDTDNESAV